MKVALKISFRLAGESLPPPQVCGRPPAALHEIFLTRFVSKQSGRKFIFSSKNYGLLKVAASDVVLYLSF
jgi:hypothetical protein